MLGINTSFKNDTCDKELYPNICICDENMQCYFEEINNIAIYVAGVVIGVLCYQFMVNLDNYHAENDLHVSRNGKLYVRRIATN
jgi:hypothetical protein